MIETRIGTATKFRGGKIEDPKTVHETWEPLCDPFIKISFDRAFDPHQARPNSGVMARNSSGEILAYVAICHKPISSPFATEAQACIQALRSRNSLANHLAKASLEKGEDIYLIGGVPNYVRWADETMDPGLIWKG
ncbi:hypothetical protein Gotri_014482, partial [Gossypium trilobum]|nr:hypothetical protein [Gossypium trilobum]